MDQRKENERPTFAASSEALLASAAPRLSRAPRRRTHPLLIWTAAGVPALVVTFVTTTLLLNRSARPNIPSAPLSIYLLSSDLRAFDASNGALRWSEETVQLSWGPTVG